MEKTTFPKGRYIMRDHELEDIYDRLYKLSVALAETVAIVKELQSDVKKKYPLQYEWDVDVDEDGPFKRKITASTDRAHQVIGKIKKPSPVPGGTEDD
jgi:hypothetical protein